MSTAYNRIRIRGDRAKPFSDVLDEVLGATPVFPHGRNIAVEVALFNNDVLHNLADILSLTLSIKDVTAAGVIEPTAADLLTKTVSAASFNTQLTEDAWTNDSPVGSVSTSYHAVFNLAYSETGGISMTNHSNNVKSFGLVISAATDAGIIVLRTGVIFFRYDGAGATVGTPPTASYTFTDAQILGALAAKLNAGENDAGVPLILRGPNGHGIELYVDDSSGTPELKQIKHPPL